MFRRLQTRGLPGDTRPDPSPLFWDLRLDDDLGTWSLELQAWASGAWRTPEQADWLRAHGLPVPPPDGSVALSAADLDRMMALLAPVSTVSWAAMEAHAEAVRLQQHGQAAEALEAVQKLMGLAPAWPDARLLHVTMLIQQARDADAAELALADLPADLLGPAQLRTLRQSIALLRDDWPAYAAEVRATIDEGDTSWWHFEVLGLSLWAAEDLSGALGVLNEGLAHHPDHRDLELRRVEVLDALGRVSEAITELDRLSVTDPSHAKTWALRGWVVRETAPTEAAERYGQALVHNPEEPVARVGRGLQRLERGDVDGARADLEPFARCGWAAAWDAWCLFSAGQGEHPVMDDSHDHDHDHP